MFKNLKIGFAAIIAMLALTATIASQAGVFSPKLAKAAFATGCYTSVTTQTPPAAVTINEGDPCNTPLPQNRNVASFGTPVDNDVECDFSSLTQICCIQVVDDVITGYVCAIYDPQAK